jgi:hypothetical protein
MDVDRRRELFQGRTQYARNAQRRPDFMSMGAQSDIGEENH